MNSRKIVIIGAGGHGKVIADIANLNNYNEIIFLDDDINKKKNGKYLVRGTFRDINNYIENKNIYDFFVAIGNNLIRKKIYTLLKKENVYFPILVHPSAIIDSSVEIGEGTVVMANVVINSQTIIKNCCIINTSSSIDHDCVIDSYVHISPGVHIAGNVKIGENSWIGIGASVINNLNIESNCIIGAGSVVIKNIEQSGVYIGVPAKKHSGEII